MILDKLEALIRALDYEQLIDELEKSSNDVGLYEETFENGDCLYHRVVRAEELNEQSKIKFVYILSDAGFDVNHQNNDKLQTCLHLAVMDGLCDLVYCLLQNGADLTITDQLGLCAYNYARRHEDPGLSKKIISIMQSFYPTYWIAIDNADIDVVRRLINSWCKFNLRKKNRSLIEYARERKFKPAFDLFVSLEAQMELCSAVMACNVAKVKRILDKSSSSLRLNFKNMKEKGATVFYYAVRQNNVELMRTLLKLKPNLLAEYILDDSDIDYPLYFYALKSNTDRECLKLMTPEVAQTGHGLDISQIYYRGKSFLRYAIEIELDLQTLEMFLSPRYCSNELITVKDPDWLCAKEYAIRENKPEYAHLIDKVTVDYILNSKSMRMQLAFNGFDFNQALKSLNHNGVDLNTYARENNLQEVVDFLKNVDNYQKKIQEFHKNVEKNDYYGVKCACKIDPTINSDDVNFTDVFLSNLILSKNRNESQSVLHKAVLNSYYQILELLLDTIVEDSNSKTAFKLDSIRDHCYRTPFHYACGMDNNKPMVQLLSQFGFSDNVYDKDGMTPLDFQERLASEELQELIRLNRVRKFTDDEPNPWTWKVWTKLQRDRDNLKTLIPFSNPLLIPNFPFHGHSHNHSHLHRHTTCHHSHPNHHQHHQHEDDDHNYESDTDYETIKKNSDCQIL